MTTNFYILLLKFVCAEIDLNLIFKLIKIHLCLTLKVKNWMLTGFSFLNSQMGNHLKEEKGRKEGKRSFQNISNCKAHCDRLRWVSENDTKHSPLSVWFSVCLSLCPAFVASFHTERELWARKVYFNSWSPSTLGIEAYYL